MTLFTYPVVEHHIQSKRLCYVYIYDYVALHNVGIVIDSHFKYDFNLDNRKLTITNDDHVADNFWGNHIYSVTSLVGDNGSGKTTALRQIMEGVVAGTDKRNLDAMFAMVENNVFTVLIPTFLWYKSSGLTRHQRRNECGNAKGKDL